MPWIIGNEYYVNLASQILIYALLALSLNLLLGYGGMVSLGHAGYLGLAGYACHPAGHGRLRPAHGGDPRGRVLDRLRRAVRRAVAARAGIGFLMITLALGQIVWGIAYRANDLTGGDNGITPSGAADAVRHRHQFARSSFYYFTLIVFAIALFCIWRFSRSPFGAA